MSEEKDTKTDTSEAQQKTETGPQNEEAAQQKQETSLKAAKASNKQKKSRQEKTAGPEKHFPWAATTILILLVALGAGNYWQFQQNQLLKQTQSQFGEKLSATTQSITSLDSQINETSDRQNQLVERTQTNEQNQQSLQAALEQMSNQLKELAVARGKEPLYWKVSEVEYLLSVANHRLILEKDVNTATAALEDADKRLKAVGDPGLIPIRKQVASEIGMLKEVSLPDIAGIASQLSSMANTVGKLPFVKNARDLDSIGKPTTGKAADDEPNLVSRLIKDIGSSLFTIQRTDKPVEPLLPPEEKQFLKHNLGLKVEQARVALLNRDTELFQKNLMAIEEWTQKYFDQQDMAVTSMLQTIATLKQVNLQPDIPDISNSLRNLRAWLDQQKQVAASPQTLNHRQAKLAASKITKE